ncbi:hypothetical protein, partial [Xanthobacter autotrophicus]|uniref:hypothetical protein n=1 Tax=Xanthobacter autotrophicus TaxID=280 RepID=UPI0024A62E4C
MADARRLQILLRVDVLMRLYRTVPFLAAALFAGTASAALAQVQAQYQRPGQIESLPLPPPGTIPAPPGTIPAPRQAAP